MPDCLLFTVLFCMWGRCIISVSVQILGVIMGVCQHVKCRQPNFLFDWESEWLTSYWNHCWIPGKAENNYHLDTFWGSIIYKKVDSGSFAGTGKLSWKWESSERDVVGSDAIGDIIRIHNYLKLALVLLFS